MSDLLTFEQTCNNLTEAGLSYGVLQLETGFVVITERGGRILGPFLDRNHATSLSWVNPALADPTSLKHFLQQDDWNLGGDRIWIAPEFQYMAKDRDNFEATYELPSDMDPGNWKLTQIGSGSWQLEQDLNLTAYIDKSPIARKLHLSKLISSLPDPLRYTPEYQELVEAVSFVGYKQTVSLNQLSDDLSLSAAWSLFQVNAGGQVIVPLTRPAQPTVYTPPDEPGADYLSQADNYLRLKIDARKTYKVGFSSSCLTGRFGYLHEADKNNAYLIIRSYLNNPSEEYIEEPNHLPGHRGDSAHVYNDNGLLGDFGELECQCGPVSGRPGKQTATDNLILWAYSGPIAKLQTIANYLLQVNLT